MMPGAEIGAGVPLVAWAKGFVALSIHPFRMMWRADSRKADEARHE